MDKGDRIEDMLTFIRRTLGGIHQSFEYLNTSEFLVIGEYEVKGRKELARVKYDTLTKMLKNGYDTYFSPDLEEPFPILNLLNGIEKPEIRDAQEGITAFISYSKKDIELKNDLKEHLMPLIRNRRIRIWDDGEIQPGETWEDEITKHVEQDPIIFLLISASYIATEFVWSIELPKALERQAKGDATVIPVILRPSSWGDMDFAKLQVLPDKGRAITEWPDKDQAFLRVVQGVEKVWNRRKYLGYFIEGRVRTITDNSLKRNLR